MTDKRILEIRRRLRNINDMSPQGVKHHYEGDIKYLLQTMFGNSSVNKGLTTPHVECTDIHNGEEPHAV